MGLYAGGFKSEIDFALEPGWTYIWVGLYPDGPFFEILRYFVIYSFTLYSVAFYNRFIFECLAFIRVFDFSKHSITFDKRNHLVVDFIVLAFLHRTWILRNFAITIFRISQ